MNTNIRLGDYSATPLYNIKAVVQATGVTPSTLRAWERRYGMVLPHRSQSGYRLYSDQDVAVIHWLKGQVDQGMAISQAVMRLEQIMEAADERAAVILPYHANTVEAPAISALHDHAEVRDFPTLQMELTDALIRYDEKSANVVIAEAFALYSVEDVGEKLFPPVLVEIGARWHRGEVSITQEHYATNYLIQRLTAIIHGTERNDNGPILWVGCAAGEEHEVGALLASLYLRRAGYQVHYLGQDVPVEDFVAEVRRKEPSMIILSANSEQTVDALRDVARRLDTLNSTHPLLGYGGRIFNQRPELRDSIRGIYLGGSARDCVGMVNQALRGPHPFASP